MGHWKVLVLTATHSAGLFPSLASRPSFANRTAFSPLQAAVRGQRDDRGHKPLGRRPWQGLEGPAPGRAEAARQGGLKEAGRRALRWMGLSLPLLPLLGQCNQGYPSPSLGPWQPARQHSDSIASSSIFHQPGERGAREGRMEPEGTCPPSTPAFSLQPAPQHRLCPLAQATGQASLMESLCGVAWADET